jgi:hypothetical protein
LVLLAGAGATTAAAVTTGDNVALSGSDTLYEVTQDVIAACSGPFPTFGSKNITYLGGGSGVGLVQMQLGAQEIAPMSRAMKSTEYCAATPDNAAALMVGLDGVAIVSNPTQSCSTTTTNDVGNHSFNIQAGGTGANTGSYTLSSSLGEGIDALRVLFMGIDQTGNTANANFGCGSDLRKTMIKNWNNLFRVACPGGAAHCPKGLSHAWRRPDVSGTTDAFVGVLTASAGAGTALGTMSFVPVGSAQKINPFCNTVDANDRANVGAGSYLDQAEFASALANGSVNDQSDHDPVRTSCDTCDDPAHCYDMVCGPDGKLGVVLPIFIPDVAYPAAEIYPTTDCSQSCVLVPPIVGSDAPVGFKCPNGQDPILGRCNQPYIEDVAKDPRCRTTDPTTRCFGTPNGVDGRVHNLPTIVLASELPAAKRFPGATYQFGLDRNNRILNGSFYRVHQVGPSSYNTRVADANYTGSCLERDDTGQIGCLADADDCSIGYAGREGARTYPGAGGNPPLAANKALGVNNIKPFPDSNLTDLLVGSGTTYPIARRLYVATGPSGRSFNTLPGQANPPTSGEAMLAKCYSQDSLVATAISTNGYLPIPAAQGGVQCLDYDQTKSTTSPPVNTPGPGNIALPGCGTAGATANGCANVDTAHGWRFGL